MWVATGGLTEREILQLQVDPQLSYLQVFRTGFLLLSCKRTCKMRKGNGLVASGLATEREMLQLQVDPLVCVFVA
jgi:hypothetical protein